MKRWKVLFYSVLLSVPAGVMVLGAVYFCLVHAPRIIRGEPRRITMLYREAAERLKARADAVAPVARRPTGAANGKIDGMPWGYFVKGDDAFVWVQSVAPDGKRQWRIAAEPRHDPLFTAPFVYGAAAGVVLLAALPSVFAVVGLVGFMRERDDFLAATAHDLTTPLVGLRLTIGRDDDEARLLVDRMLRIVENIRDFLRLGGRRRAPEVSSFDVLDAVRAAYALFAADYRDLWDGNDVPIESAGGALCVRADETMCVQILWNLFGNDLKYAAPYGRVAVSAARDGGFVRVAFTDEGPGMTPRQRRRAFDRYYRAKTVLETGKGGFGIGLCAAREFARAMGGDLTVAANAPSGCVFTLSLPAAI